MRTKKARCIFLPMLALWIGLAACGSAVSAGEPAPAACALVDSSSWLGAGSGRMAKATPPEDRLMCISPPLYCVPK